MTVTLPAPPEGPELLDHLADLLAATAADLPHSLAVGAARHGEQVELHLRELERHPADELVGFTAPDAWCAFGIAAHGHSRHLAPARAGGRPGDAHRASRRGTPVTLVHLVHRDGSHRSRIDRIDGAPVLLDHGAAGTLHDICRRVLGLPTEPPPASPLDYWARAWLTGVLDAATGPAERPGWAAVAALHPAVAAVAGAEPRLGSAAVEHLAEAGRALAAAQPWERLRQLWAEQGGHADLAPEELRWMDDWMLARWRLGALPDVRDLRDHLGAVLAPGVLRRVDEVLAAWHVDRAAPPAA